MEKEYKLQHKKRSLGFSIKMLLATVAFTSITNASSGSFSPQDTVRVDEDKNKTELFTENAQTINSTNATKKTLVIEGRKNQIKNLSAVVSDLKKSDYGKDVLLNADTTGLKLLFDSQDGMHGYYNPIRHIIALNSSNSKGTQISFLAHEATHAKQKTTGSGNMAGLSFDEYLLLFRAVEADACAGQVQACWELKQKGNSKPWNATLNTPYRDIALAFEKEAKRNPSSVNNGAAKKAAYDQWFKDEWRRDMYDAQAAKKIKAMVDGAIYSTVYYFSGKESIFSRFETIGRLSNGKNYLLTGTEKDSLLKGDFYTGNISADNKRELDNLKKQINNFFKTLEQPNNTSTISEDKSDDKQGNDGKNDGTLPRAPRTNNQPNRAPRQGRRPQRGNQRNPQPTSGGGRNKFPNPRGRIIKREGR